MWGDRETIDKSWIEKGEDKRVAPKAEHPKSPPQTMTDVLDILLHTTAFTEAAKSTKPIRQGRDDDQYGITRRSVRRSDHRPVIFRYVPAEIRFSVKEKKWYSRSLPQRACCCTPHRDEHRIRRTQRNATLRYATPSDHEAAVTRRRSRVSVSGAWSASDRRRRPFFDRRNIRLDRASYRFRWVFDQPIRIISCDTLLN